jgi:hypothetical protein
MTGVRHPVFARVYLWLGRLMVWLGRLMAREVRVLGLARSPRAAEP